MGASRTVLVHTSPRCNYSCRYCYAVHHERPPSADQSARMTLSTVRQLFEVLSSAALANWTHLDVVWHGGEPMLLGRRFFEGALEESADRLDGRGFTVHHHVQSNLSLLDADWLDVLSAHSVQVSTSLDFPRDVHDALRRTRSGDTTYDKTLASIRALQGGGVCVGAVSVINSRNVHRPHEVYATVKDLADDCDLSVQFIPCHAGATGQGKNLVPTPADLLAFWTDLFDLWASDDAPPRIADFSFLCKSVLGTAVGLCAFAQDCTADIVAVDSDGYVWPCCSCIGHDGFRLAHLSEDAGADYLLGLRPTPFSGRATRLPLACHQCDVLELCFGGCMSMAFESARAFDAADPFCSAYKGFFRHVRRRVGALVSHVAQ